MSKFGDTERKIKDLFLQAKNFSYECREYAVLKCGKPVVSKGECKTDIYVLAQDEIGCQKEFKISIKQNDADFLENKISLNRAVEILGNDAQTIIEKSIAKIKKSFEDDYLVYFNPYKRTEALCLKIGWKFEFINKIGGERSGIIDLTEQQKIDIYAGTNLSSDKKNSSVNGQTIVNSGVANYIITVDAEDQNLDYYLAKMQPIENFAKVQKIYFACKALNYRVNKNKWDGDRPLSVYVDWSLDENRKLQGKLNFEKPLSVKGNIIGTNIKKILTTLGIDKNNFNELKTYLHDNVRRI
ncbi:hypothetical protein [Parabacteroides chinchillae]|uniref:Restriction endonuclease n=1 Tax=Parabacteroides chinchillae TaxID=871327 RepID=A0A8G2BWH9_9BACT|nr:hypothetical protein [Parabacteroides chinchillae]SEF81442.1 hypothetical protein SAMN05444001_107132 [Parabacteroides chinchillae]